MQKKLLLSSVAAMIGLTGFAETSVLDYSYVQGDLSAYGKAKKETIDVAMCINDPALAGMKIKGIKAYVNTSEGLSETSLWLSKELTLENKVNVPDVASFNVTPVPATYGGLDYELGLMEVTLDEPYVLTGDPIYVGYTLTVNDLQTNGEKYPIVKGQPVNSEGLYLHMSKSILKWVDYSTQANGSALIVVAIEGDFPAYSLGIKGYNPIYAEPMEEFEGVFNLTNIGANAVENITYEYSYDGQNFNTNTCKLDTPIEPSLTGVTSVSLSFAGIESLGSHDVTVKITEVNGQPNVSSADAIVCKVNVIPFTPVKRPLVEEYTGLWCGWCPRGFLAMEMIAEDYPDEQVSICYHNGDPMAVTNRYPMSISGFPSASIDRVAVLDPYYGSYSDREFGIGQDLLDAMDELAIADIDVQAWFEDENTVRTKATVRFIQDIDNANYRIGYILVANGLSDSGWAQENYYAGRSGYTGSPLEELTTWPAKKYDLVFNDVAIDVSGMSGVAGSLPSSISIGREYENWFNFNIGKNALAANHDNLVATAFIIDNKTGHIVNANKWKLSESAGVNQTAVEKATVVAREYFDLTGRRVNNPSKGIYIVSEKLSNGNVRTSKVMLDK